MPALLTMMSTRPNASTAAVDQALEVRDLADVGFDADRLVTQRCHLRLERLGRLRVAHIVDDDVGTLASEREHDPLPDAAVSTSDDRHLALEGHVVDPFSRSTRCSPTRIAFAITVSAGFTAPMLGKKLVSTT